jgi:hypothetical protein
VLSSSLLILLLSSQGAAACENVEVCRAQALIAHAKGDFESFHDHAWAAYRKGKPNDPELMLLIARAQSLSGRPGDSLVMLERVGAQGKVPADVATDPEFERVRALPRWNEVSSRLLATAGGEPVNSPSETSKSEARAEAPKPEPPKKAPAVKLEPAKPEPPKAEPVKPEPLKSDPPKSSAAKPDTPTREAPKPEVAAPKPAPASPVAPARVPGTPLKFATVLTPTALAYDRVSKRYIIGDRRARRIAVIDEHSGQVSTLVGALGALGDVDGVAIDAQQGDLWVVTSDESGASLSKMQLISGRVLSTVRLRDVSSPVVSMSFVAGSGLVAADGAGILWAIRPGGRGEKLAALEYVPKALGSDGRGRLYVSAGGPRMARFAMAPFRRLGTVELDTGSAPEGPFVVVGDRLESLLPSGDGYELVSRSVK